MPDDAYRELTEKHDHVARRVTQSESVQRGNKRWLITAILAALGTAGGSGGLAYMDSQGDDTVESVVSTHIALSDNWIDGVNTDLDRVMHQQRQLRDAIIRLQVTVDNLSDKHRGGNGGGQIKRQLSDVENILKGIDTAVRNRDGQRGPPNVGAVRNRLFGRDH